MLGWEIVVYRHDLAPDPDRIFPGHPALLARWLVNLGGLDWINNLVRDGKATDLSTSGYPMTYLAKASDVLPLIADGPPKYTDPFVAGEGCGWIRNVLFHNDRIAACPLDVMLLILAWDQS